MTGDPPVEGSKKTRMRGEERREYILAHAKNVFAQHGYAESSTSELARASDVTEPMLYKHFGSKKGLFMAVVREFSEQLIQRLRRQADQRVEKDLLEALGNILLDYRASVASDPDLQKVLFQAIADSGDPEIAQCIGRHNRRVYQLIYELLEQAQAAGYLYRDLNLEAATWGYISFIMAMQFSTMAGVNDQLNGAVLAEINRLWLRALRSGST